MPPAARVGDPTSHGTSLSPGPGSPNVLIGGKPAWRGNSDFHICPLIESSRPHIGGVVLAGSRSVLINDMPACRVGDLISETAPNTIVAGCPTVLIG